MAGFTEEEWEKAAGIPCPRCRRLALRFRPEDGVCRNCADKLNEKEMRDDRAKERFNKFRKAHNARLEKKKAQIR